MLNHTEVKLVKVGSLNTAFRKNTNQKIALTISALYHAVVHGNVAFADDWQRTDATMLDAVLRPLFPMSYSNKGKKYSFNGVKAKEVQEAITKGIEDAKKNLIKVPVMKGTIPHDQWAKEGAAKVLIKPAAHGTGVIAGGSMRAVLEAAGVTDVLAKSLGSANPHNVVKATFKALAMLREPIHVAKTRTMGLKKVFNG